MKTLSLYIDDLIVPLLGGILAILDTHSNLDLPFQKEENIKELWEMFYRDENIINLSYLITERALSSPYSILNHSKKLKIEKNCFPFFQNIYQQVNHLFHRMCTNIGKLILFLKVSYLSKAPDRRDGSMPWFEQPRFLEINKQPLGTHSSD